MATSITLKNVRIAFAQIFEPKAQIGDDGKPGTPKFSAIAILDPAQHKAEIAALDAGMLAVAQAKWADKAQTILAHLKSVDKTAYRAGPKKDASGEVYDGFEGMHYLSASTPRRPTVIDRNKSPLTQADGRPYSGCYVNMIVELWPQDNKHGKRINAELKGLQFVKDGDSFSGGAPASPDDFEDLGIPGAEETADIV